MTSRQVIDDLRRIVGAEKPSEQPAPHAPRDPIAGTRGISNASKAADTAGIASPLTEGINAATGNPAREYYGTQLKTSSDGLFVLPIKPIKTLNFKDALGNPVVVQLAEPKPDPSGTTP